MKNPKLWARVDLSVYDKSVYCFLREQECDGIPYGYAGCIKYKEIYTSVGITFKQAKESCKKLISLGFMDWEFFDKGIYLYRTS